MKPRRQYSKNLGTRNLNVRGREAYCVEPVVQVLRGKCSLMFSKGLLPPVGKQPQSFLEFKLRPGRLRFMILEKSKGGSLFRKIAMGSWSTVGDPSVYGLLEIDMKKTLKFLEDFNSTNQTRIGITEVVAKATAEVLRERPEMNGLIRFGRIYLRKDVDIFFQVNVPGGDSDAVGKATLLGLVVKNVDKKSLLDIAVEFKDRARKLKSGEQNDMTRSARNLTRVPWILMKWVLNITSFLTYDLRLPMKKFGLPTDPFGSLMITNVGSLGIDTAWAPLVPYTRVPLLLAIGACKDRAWVVDGQIEIRPVLRIGCTFDHRFMDGVHAAAMSKRFTELFQNPERFL